MQFCRSVDGVRFWALHDRNLYFFMLISRWFVMHSGVILHDFVHPSGSLISIYEWSSRQLKTRNFHHFLTCFLYGTNTVTRDVCWIFWKMNVKLGRKQMIHFRAICTPVLCLFTFSRDLEKNVILGTICECPQYNLGFQRPPKNDQKWPFLECRCFRRRAKWGQNPGAGTLLIFLCSAISGGSISVFWIV